MLDRPLLWDLCIQHCRIHLLPARCSCCHRWLRQVCCAPTQRQSKDLRSTQAPVQMLQQVSTPFFLEITQSPPSFLRLQSIAGLGNP